MIFLKRIVVLIAFIFAIFLLSVQESIKIANESIRFRIVAASNSFKDQQLKQKIKNDLITNVIPNILTDSSINDAKKLIKDSISKIENILDSYKINYSVNFGQNYFPQKVYQGVIYPAGNYESLVITLGEGLGDNWWCVLYPPLCLIENNYNSTDIEYRSYIKDLILKDNHH